MHAVFRLEGKPVRIGTEHHRLDGCLLIADAEIAVTGTEIAREIGKLSANQNRAELLVLLQAEGNIAIELADAQD